MTYLILTIVTDITGNYRLMFFVAESRCLSLAVVLRSSAILQIH